MKYWFKRLGPRSYAVICDAVQVFEGTFGEGLAFIQMALGRDVF